MVNQTLVEYIKSVKAQGYSDTAVVEALRKNGWSDNDINEAYSFVNLAAQTPSAPMAPKAPTPSALPSYTVEPKTMPAQSAQVAIPEESNNSPFSFGLAIVLFVSLFILVNKIIHDIGQNFYSNINSKLVFDAILVIPFLFVSFLLYGIASQNKKRYIILCQPYFVVSAFLFLRLLWNVGSYILSANATYGVYIVLVMAIVVLTGFVIFLQKFLKS